MFENQRHRLTKEKIEHYRIWLLREERAPATVEKYLHDIHAFSVWLQGRPVCKDVTAKWKAALVEQGLAPSTVNGKLAALHSFFALPAGRNVVCAFCVSSGGCSAARKKTFRAKSTSACLPPPSGSIRLNFACSWKPSAPPVSGYPRQDTSQRRPCKRALRKSRSRARSARFCCPVRSAASCANSRRGAASRAGRSFWKQTAGRCPAARSGRG